ncbi:M20/M25/M40 family metallo-hydrolase [Deinococcus radiophilus]|uniref:M20 family peptidase n=1 Tax=Deinococcus radiophilus TaxID=32062 RepID=A0A431W429_9DEIO|nr:M20/M25/M40 family metallo-hydrolase [Deinococcus radiophilus]RTR30236.1 M20 family peptidase [Deinococcus radiophilus]UFA49972.1 M20/M25/M40 family metallo-hydrolase [Deinococcus radiophilus]
MTLFWPDPAALEADLLTLAALESPSGDAAAIGQVMAVLEGWARELGGETQTLSGGTRRFAFGVDGQASPLLILAHADTVWPQGTLAQMPLRKDAERLYGPGVYDMKAGLVGGFHALRALGGEWPAGGVVLLVTPDEEVGSPSSRGHIEAEAHAARAALVPEPPVGEGSAEHAHALKTGRKGVIDAAVTLTGRAAHAGNEPERGSSAVAAAAELIGRIEAVARPELGTTVLVTQIAGGTASNVVPAECRLTLDVRVSQAGEDERVLRELAALTPADSRVQADWHLSVNRPPFPRNAETLALFAQAQAAAQELGFTLTETSVGGGSDGNFTAPLCPTLDGLGAPGDGAHAAHEHIRLDLWTERVALLTALLRRL